MKYCFNMYYIVAVLLLYLKSNYCYNIIDINLDLITNNTNISKNTSLHTKLHEYNNNLAYNSCNIKYSLIAIFIINDLILMQNTTHFNSYQFDSIFLNTSDIENLFLNNFIINSNTTNKDTVYKELSILNEINNIYNKESNVLNINNIDNFNINNNCNECLLEGITKKFKNIALLDLHKMLFHRKQFKLNNKNFIYLSNFCLADYCSILNCKKYEDLFIENIKYFYDKNVAYFRQDNQYNVLNNRNYNCIQEFVPYYKQFCIQFFKSLFKNNFNLEKILKFCININCDNKDNIDILEINEHIDLYKSRNTLSIIKTIFSCISFVFVLLFLIIKWIDKFVN